MAKKSVLLCDLCDPDDPRFASESVRVTYTFGSRKNLRVDVCNEHLNAVSVPDLNTEEQTKIATRAYKKPAPRPTNHAEARALNKDRKFNGRYVQCGYCNEYVTINNMTQHNRNRHDKADRFYGEVDDAPSQG